MTVADRLTGQLMAHRMDLRRRRDALAFLGTHPDVDHARADLDAALAHLDNAVEHLTHLATTTETTS